MAKRAQSKSKPQRLTRGTNPLYNAFIQYATSLPPQSRKMAAMSAIEKIKTVVDTWADWKEPKASPARSRTSGKNATAQKSTRQSMRQAPSTPRTAARSTRGRSRVSQSSGQSDQGGETSSPLANGAASADYGQA